MNRGPFIAALVFAILVVFGVHLLEFPGSVPNFEKESGGGTLLDVRPSFSEEATYARLENYGERGRKNYVFRNLTTDVLLPLSLFPFLFLLMRHSIGRVRLGRASRIFLLSLPFAYVAFDLAENGSVLALLANYPNRLTFLSSVLPYVTVIKRAASMLALAVPLVVFIFVLLRGGPPRTIASSD